MAEQGTRLEGGIVETLESGRLTTEPVLSGDDIYTHLAEQIDVTRWRPQLDAGVDMTEFSLAGGGSYFVVANADRSTHLRLTAAEVDVLRRLDGDTSIGQLIVDQLTEDGELDSRDIVDLVKLAEAKGYLVERPVDVFVALDHALHRPTFVSRLDRFVRTLTIEWSGAERTVTRLYSAIFRYTFNRVAAIAALIVVVLGAAAYIDVTSTHHFQLTNRHFGVAFVVLLVLDLLIVAIHEFGHASVLVHYRRRVGGAGFRIYFGAPSFFIDSADALMLTTPRRIFQSAAGPMFELVGTSIAAIALWTFPSGTVGRTLYQFMIINYFVLFMNLIPMLELDGYWILSDALRQPNLRPESLAFVRREMWRKVARREGFRRREVGLAAFGIAGIAFTVFSFVSAWFFWRRVFGDTIISMWRGGVAGKLLLLALGLLLGGPTLRLAVAAGRSLTGRFLALVSRIRFRLETSWRIEAATMLDESGLFGDVPPDVLSEIAGRVRLRTLAPRAILIRQGDVSDAYYLVRSGHVEVLEEFPDGTMRTLRTEGRGAGIGDQGLIEGAPRSATVKAIERTEVFQIDKPTFDRLLTERSTRPAYAPTIQLVDELRSLGPFALLGSGDLSELAEHGRWVDLAPDEVLFSQGDVGETFYVIEHGRLAVEIDGKPVRTLSAGDHLGELALLLDAPRSASVHALTPARLFAIDRPMFDSMVADQFRRGKVRSAAVIDPIRYH